MAGCRIETPESTARDVMHQAFSGQIRSLAEKDASVQMDTFREALNGLVHCHGHEMSKLIIDFRAQLFAALTQEHERKYWVQATEKALAIFLPSEAKSLPPSDQSGSVGRR